LPVGADRVAGSPGAGSGSAAVVLSASSGWCGDGDGVTADFFLESVRADRPGKIGAAAYYT
jgi:hypothetical protein